MDRAQRRGFTWTPCCRGVPLCDAKGVLRRRIETLLNGIAAHTTKTLLGRAERRWPPRSAAFVFIRVSDMEMSLRAIRSLPAIRHEIYVRRYIGGEPPLPGVMAVPDPRGCWNASAAEEGKLYTL